MLSEIVNDGDGDVEGQATLSDIVPTDDDVTTAEQFDKIHVAPDNVDHDAGVPR